MKIADVHPVHPYLLSIMPSKYAWIASVRQVRGVLLGVRRADRHVENAARGWLQAQNWAVG